jgi:tartrate dehydratase beta subunit/fumarate hydratase class I family protein
MTGRNQVKKTMLNQVTVCLSFCKFKVGAILFFTGYNVITIRDSSHREVFIVMRRED